MSVILYKSDGCPHCVNAKELYRPEIQNGKIVLKDPSDVPAHLPIEGFPTFTKKSEDGTQVIIQVGYKDDKSEVVKHLDSTEQKEEITEKQEANKEDEKSSLSTVDIAGIVIASIAGLALIIALGFLIAKAAKKGRKSRK